MKFQTLKSVDEKIAYVAFPPAKYEVRVCYLREIGRWFRKWMRGATFTSSSPDKGCAGVDQRSAKVFATICKRKDVFRSGGVRQNLCQDL